MALKCKYLIMQLRNNPRYLSSKLLDCNWMKAVNPILMRQYQTSSKLLQTTTEEDSRSLAHDATDSSEDDVKESILNAALGFVPKYGWSKEALAAGAELIGLSRAAHGLFPNGEGDLVLYFYARCNSELEAQLLSDQQLKSNKREFVQAAVQNRLLMLDPYRDHWPQAMAIMSMPQNIVPAFRNLTKLVDTVWYCAGDRSTDFNWYSKRASLAAVYKSTEVFFIQDNSPDYQETWLFLANRLENLESMRKYFNQAASAGPVVKGLFTTLKNMLGFQNTNR
uniref:Ubiquinone biosynthesis protein n=1 Tax=Strigamia maritima TaxID=126957 RepID=T1ISB3_STRMM